jgi:hypothetical protein
MPWGPTASPSSSEPVLHAVISRRTPRPGWRLRRVGASAPAWREGLACLRACVCVTHSTGPSLCPLTAHAPRATRVPCPRFTPCCAHALALPTCLPAPWFSLHSFIKGLVKTLGPAGDFVGDEADPGGKHGIRLGDGYHNYLLVRLRECGFPSLWCARAAPTHADRPTLGSFTMNRVEG